MAEYNMPQYILREFKVTDARVSSAPPFASNEGYVYLLWEKRLPNNHSPKEKKSAIMDDFKGKEFLTLPLSGKCSHKPWLASLKCHTWTPSCGDSLGERWCWAAFTDWLAALKFTSSAHSHWRVLISSLLRAVNTLLFVQLLRSLRACRLIWSDFQTVEQMAFLGRLWQALHTLICLLAWFIPPCANVSVHENCELTTLVG